MPDFIMPDSALRFVANAHLDRSQPPGPPARDVMSLDSFRRALDEIGQWPGYAPTPLRDLPGLARRAGVGRVLYKDESRRFELESFKALGGAYAVLRLLQQDLAAAGHPGVTAAELLAGAHRQAVAGRTFATATDGNHGRSVAWGCRMFGARCVIYLHERVSAAREDAIACYGAEMRRVPGGYDDSVRACAAEAGANGWTVVADTSAGIGPLAPSLVMQGYGVMAMEMDAAGPRPTHVLVPAGVGGLAAALAAYYWEAYGPASPRIVVVEPVLADCVFRSIALGRPEAVPGDADSFMACLSAAEVSPLAWPFLRAAVDAVVALPDEAAADAMRLLAAGGDGDPAVVAGESGAATAAALLAAAADPAVRAALGLDGASVVALVGSEGATDRQTYARVVGRPAERVADAA